MLYFRKQSVGVVVVRLVIGLSISERIGYSSYSILGVVVVVVFLTLRTGVVGPLFPHRVKQRVDLQIELNQDRTKEKKKKERKEEKKGGEKKRETWKRYRQEGGERREEGMSRVEEMEIH